MDRLIDKFGRRIDYLRISVTDRCNLRCVYCMPSCGIVTKAHEELLSFEEISRIVKAAAYLGIAKIRLTGGEPLVRKNLASLIISLNKISGIKDISMTTNGVLLKEYAAELKEAGLKRINISLDSLKEDRYRSITRHGALEDVLDGIGRALENGFSHIKLNVLLLDDITEDEIKNFLILIIENNISVRFLEFMPVNSFYKSENFVSCKTVMAVAKRLGVVEESKALGSGPAKEYRLKDGLGTFGLISPMSDKFCASCNRLRLTSDGFMKSCLHSDLKVDLRNPLRKGIDEEGLARLIKLAVDIKPKEHSLDKGVPLVHEFSMCQIGG